MVGCSSNLENPQNSCDIFSNQPSWYRYAKQSEKEFSVPVSTQLAIIYQESSFNRASLPQRKYVLGFIPWGYISSAKGYSQALDAVWEEYLQDRGGILSSRHRFKDTTDFIGWYFNRFAPKANIKYSDTFSLYILYHEGLGGYRSGKWKKNKRLIQIAKKVEARAKMYKNQLKACQVYFNTTSLYFI